jgi:phosphoglycerate kinase
MGKVDRVLVGGGMAATFLKARGAEIGLSLFEADRVETALQIMHDALKRNVHFVLPFDVLVADKIAADATSRVVPADSIPATMRIVDIGPRTIKAFQEQLTASKTVFWNGPMGVYEVPKFGEGTRALALTLASLKASTVIGGGSTADVVAELGLESKMTFVSTGGGASLSFLSGEKLPGVEALADKE